jgi:hypothetical protein
MLEHVIGIGCEEEIKEGKGPQLKKCFLGKEGRKCLLERTGAWRS